MPAADIFFMNALRVISAFMTSAPYAFRAAALVLPNRRGVNLATY
jgi:hypothetical protein